MLPLKETKIAYAMNKNRYNICFTLLSPVTSAHFEKRELQYFANALLYSYLSYKFQTNVN